MFLHKIASLDLAAPGAKKCCKQSSQLPAVFSSATDFETEPGTREAQRALITLEIRALEKNLSAPCFAPSLHPR